MNRQVSELVRHQNPLMLQPTATVQHACREMRHRRVGAVLVVDAQQHLLGIFTARDAVCRVLAEARNPAAATLGEVMTPRPAALPATAHAVDALRLMQDGGFRHVPILEGQHVTGVVARGDFRGLEHARLDEETGYFERLR